MKSRFAGLRTLVLPGTAGPGQARIVIGPDLPPALDTYVPSVPFPAATGYAGAIIFYSGGDDTTYVYAAVVDDGTLGSIAGLVIGMVANNSVRETAPGYPDGVIWRADFTSGATDLYTNGQAVNHHSERDMLISTERGDITVQANNVAGLGGNVDIVALADMVLRANGLGSVGLTIDANFTDVLQLLTLQVGADSQIGNGYKVLGENGRVLLLLDERQASGSIAGLGLGAATVPGCSITFDTFAAETHIKVMGFFDFSDSAVTTSIAVGECVIDGVVQVRQALLQSEGSNNVRATVGQQWTANLAPGSHTITLQARATVAAVWTCNAVHTDMTLEAFH